MNPYPPELKQEAQRLYQEGLPLNQIARKLGVASNTVGRWCQPELAERSRIQSRDRKRAIRGTCEICGGVTKCCRPGASLPSLICGSCSRERQAAKKVWTRERVVEAIQEWARRRGRPPVSTEWVRSVVDPDGYRFPARTSVYRSQASRKAPFSSWAEAIEQAGFPRPRIGVKRNDLPRLPPRKPRNAAERREYAIAALRRALAKEDRDGNRDRKGNDHDRAGHTAGA